MPTIFQSPHLKRLLHKLARRIEQGKPLGTGRVTLSSSTPGERSAADDLLGRRATQGSQLSIDLAILCASLRTDAAGLHKIVEQTIGHPLTDLRAARETATVTWDALFQEFPGHDPGTVKRLSSSDPTTARTLLSHAKKITTGKPYNNLLLATLAANTTGDSHALDRGRPLGTLLVAQLSTAPRTPANRRKAWADIGVIVDDLSAPVLCLNLRAAPGSALAPWINWHADHHEPLYLPWRQLHRFEPHAATKNVFICENPAIVSEAATHPTAPLICLNGQPTTTAHALLQKLVPAQIHVHADFDWPGLRIADQILRHHPTARPWRMTPADYQRCTASVPLKENPFHASWAEQLTATMQTRALAAYEEDQVETLLRDLKSYRH